MKGSGGAEVYERREKGRGGCNLKEQKQGKRGEEVRRGED